ncbi:MAG: transport system, NAD-binding component, partial [Acidimicrobiia bacterium]|nr:transport system, NAD-binding component [Acidimicrobiia bacterium]
MHVVVVGCGRVGSGLASSLTGAGHTVAVVDRRSSAFSRLPPDFPGKQLTGIGFDRDVLKEAGIEGAAAVAAVTNGDNSNILIARVARETFGIDRVVARIYDPRRAVIFQRLGIPTVATVAWTTERVLRRILPDEAVEWVDPSANVSMVERLVPAALAGRPISEFEVEGAVRFTAVSRLGSAQVAKPQIILQEGDVVYAAVATEGLAAFDARISGH